MARRWTCADALLDPSPKRALPIEADPSFRTTRQAGMMQFDRSCLLDLLAQIPRRSLVSVLDLACASLTPRLAQASVSQPLPPGNVVPDSPTPERKRARNCLARRPRALTRRQGCRTFVGRVRAPGPRRSPWNVRTRNARCGIPCLGVVASGFRVFRVFRGSTNAELWTPCMQGRGGGVLPRVGEGEPCEVLERGEGLEPRNTRNTRKEALLVPADRVRGPESSQAVHDARFP